MTSSCCLALTKKIAGMAILDSIVPGSYEVHLVLWIGGGKPREQAQVRKHVCC